MALKYTFFGQYSLKKYTKYKPLCNIILRKANLMNIFFTLVDRNISIMGCRTFGCTGTATYDLTLYDCSDEKNPRSLQKLNCTLNRNDCVDGMVQLKFTKGISVQANVKYALVCRTSVGLAAYGEQGLAFINGPDGTKIDFRTSTYHGKGRTSIVSGQLSQILYGTETGKQIQVSFKYLLTVFPANSFLKL